MSINYLKNLFDAEEIKFSNYSICIDFYKKFTYFSFVLKLLKNFQKQNKKLVVINFDILFYKYISNFSFCKIDISDFLFSETKINNLFPVTNPIILNHFINYMTEDEERNLYLIITKLLEIDANNLFLIVIGLDLLEINRIRKFFFLTRKISHSINNSLHIFSTDNSSNNLIEENELKKNLIKSKVDLFMVEKLNKKLDTKLLLYLELYNLRKLTREVSIFEFLKTNEISNSITNYNFEKINIYLKEYKDLFETEVHHEVEPSSTFKLNLNEKELQQKNETVLPYLKTQEENRIIIDQEDLNELYEEDPDGDLDI